MLTWGCFDMIKVLKNYSAKSERRESQLAQLYALLNAQTDININKVMAAVKDKGTELKKFILELISDILLDKIEGLVDDPDAAFIMDDE